VPDIDVVIVSYNSASKLARCVAGLARDDGVRATVVDNASGDGSVALLAELGITTIALGWNSGFSHGCNVGWKTGSSEFVLFLNPDAAIDADGVRRLAAVLASDRNCGIVAPKIVHENGEFARSLRRFPSLSRTFAQAFFLHRLAPDAAWSDEVVRDPDAYDQPWAPDWVSGACLLVRRSLLEKLGGFDERFFLYSEDVDLCKRAREMGAKTRYEPGVTALHTGGASAPAGRALPLIATSRVLYARKHHYLPVAFLYRLGIAVSSLTHAVVAKDREHRVGHVRALVRRAPRRVSPAVSATTDN
jgi:N-acetylglucosaminyl-diphospho-decaprenol L-rhamnosyltransferase